MTSGSGEYNRPEPLVIYTNLYLDLISKPASKPYGLIILVIHHQGDNLACFGPGCAILRLKGTVRVTGKDACLFQR